jgi:penicillin-binding protein 2
MASLDESDRARQFSRRSLLLGATQAAGFSLVSWRLFDLQVLEARRYAPLAEENRVSLQVSAPRRGRLLDAFGRPLADNDEMFRATVTPALVRNVPGVLARVARIVPLTDDDIAKIVARAKKQSRNLPTVVATNLTFEQVAQLNLFAPSLPGIRTELAWSRRYHGGAAVAHVVGLVGAVDRFSLDDDAVLRLPEMRVGRSGAEAGFEADLRGAGGTQKIEVDARGHIVRNLETIDPVPGRDFTLAIDLDLQQAVTNRLQGERRAAAVVLDIRTGEIAVMASVPGFDAATIAEGISDADWQKLVAAEDKPLINRAVAGLYPPGSTFKLVTALAALEAGVATADERIACDGQYQYADQTYRCWQRSGHGEVSLHEAIRSSCDVFFFEMARRIGIAKLAATARRLGLGASYDVGLPEGKPGLIPDPDWKRGNLNAAWLGGETLLTGVGQGYVQTTPLELAVMTARIASGRALLPALLKEDASTPKPDFADLGFQASHLDLVRKGMVAAVNEEGGTGDRARLGDGRPLVAGKTGTSQVSSLTSETAEDGIEWAKRDHALFVAYEPAEAPRYAIATVIEHGGGGGTTAAPLARDILNLVIERDARLPLRRPDGPNGQAG